jgi:hypothetical protein
MQNDFDQAGAVGICTVASMQWAKKTLQLRRGLGSYDELSLSDHQLNALMRVWRQYDHDPATQTEGMGLRIVGADINVNQMIDVQRHTNLTAPHICIFWNSHHTMGYRAWNDHGRECEFFDNEDGLWLADNDTDIRATVINRFAAAGYAPIEGMRIVTL